MNVRIAECRMRCSTQAGTSQGSDSPPLAFPQSYSVLWLSERPVRPVCVQQHWEDTV